MNIMYERWLTMKIPAGEMAAIITVAEFPPRDSCNSLVSLWHWNWNEELEKECVRECERERKRERKREKGAEAEAKAERKREKKVVWVFMRVSVCVCVWEREIVFEKNRQIDRLENIGRERETKEGRARVVTTEMLCER